jgi:hypothetical protein
MKRRCGVTLWKVLLSMICSIGVSGPAFWQQAVVVQIETSGSAMEVPRLLTCIAELKKFPYSADKTHACAGTLRSSGYFTRVGTKVNATKTRVTFYLESPRLTVDALDYSGDVERDKVTEWVGRNPNTLRVGQPYTQSSAISTWKAVEMYYATQGWGVGVSTTIHLDYHAKTAKLDLHVIKGPAEPAVPVPPPYGDLCQDRVGALNWSDFDENVPVGLVREKVKLHTAISCFSEQDAESDKQVLKALGIFTTIDLTYTGPESAREVSLKLRARPISVEKIEIRRFGLSQNRDFDVTGLPLSGGSSYTRSQSEECRRLLESSFAAANTEVVVYENDELTETGRLIVVFNVVAYPQNQLFVDGRQVAD